MKLFYSISFFSMKEYLFQAVDIVQTIDTTVVMQQNSALCFDFLAIEPLSELDFQAINNENVQDLSISSTINNGFHQDIFEDISFLNFDSNQQIVCDNLTLTNTTTHLENNFENKKNNLDLNSENIEEDLFSALDKILEENSYLF